MPSAGMPVNGDNATSMIGNHYDMRSYRCMVVGVAMFDILILLSQKKIKNQKSKIHKIKRLALRVYPLSDRRIPPCLLSVYPSRSN